MASKRQSDETAPVSFRIDSMYKQMLEDRATHGESHHQVARQLVTEALDRQSGDELDLRRIAADVDQVRRQIRELRVDLAVAVQALLVASEAMDGEQAEEWVNQNMLEK